MTYKNYSWFIVIMVFLVIAAGGIVRMTGSGMGCPDWPKCFGYIIPPTDVDQVLWKANQEYSSGAIIVKDEALWKAKEAFVSSNEYNGLNWLKYEKHDYALFNVYHTWIEYINRLLGALLGVFIFIYLIWTFKKFWKERKDLVLISFILFIAVGFQGWLGKMVVDKNLDVSTITIHMVGALVIAALPLVIITRLEEKRIKTETPFKWILNLLMVAVLIQIVLGTQVREEIDIIAKSLDYENRELWIGMLSSMFIIHRSSTWIILGGALYLWFKGRANFDLGNRMNYLMLTVLITIVLGVVMAYLSIPRIAQPLHLLLACGLLMQLCYYRLIIR